MPPEPPSILQSFLQRVKGPPADTSPDGCEASPEAAEEALTRILGAALEAHADQVARNMQALLDRHADRLQEALEKHAGQLQSTVGRALGEATGQLATASTRLENASVVFHDNAMGLQAVGDGLANTTAQASGLLAPLLERLDGLSWLLDGHATALREQNECATSLARRMDELRTGVESALASLAHHVGTLGPAVTSALDASAMALGEAREAMATGLGCLAEDVHVQVELIRGGVDSWSRLQMEISESQAELLSVGNQRMESMNRTLGSLAETVRELGPVSAHLAQANEVLPGLRRLVDASVASHAALAEQIARWRESATRLQASAETLAGALEGGLAEPLLVLEGSIREAIAPLIRLVDQASDNAERLEHLWGPLMERLGSPPPAPAVVGPPPEC